MQDGDDPLLLFLFKRVFLDGDIPFHNKVDSVVGLTLLEDARSLCIGLFIQIVVDNHQLLVGEAAEHAVLAEESIVYGTFAHTQS